LLHPNYLVSQGDTVTVRGSGFTPTDNTVQIGSAKVAGVSSPDGKTLTFRAPAADGSTFIRGIQIYKAWVFNDNGRSNLISFDYR
jgi:hypothetical protein